MMEKLLQSESRDILQNLREGIPPRRISPIFVETKAAREVLDRADEKLRVVSEGNVPVFLIIRATRGAGKTAIIRYLRKQLQEKVFFIYLEKFYASGEDLFHQFVEKSERQVITEAVRNLSSDPLEVYRILSEGGHNGTAIALAGLHEDSIDSWNWLSSGSPALPKLSCGLRLVRNVRDKDALDALATVVRLLTYQKPVVFAIDELETTFNELTKKQRAKLRTLLVDLINHTKFSRIFFIFAATDDVYERCFKDEEAPSSGLTGRAINITAELSLPEKEEVVRILERTLHLYGLARGFNFTEVEIRKISERYFRDMTSVLPRQIIAYALQEGDKKWESIRGYKKIREILETASKGIMKKYDLTKLGKKFEEAVGLLLEYIPGIEEQMCQPDSALEGAQLAELMPDLKNYQKNIDWSFRIESKNFWVEVCITKRKGNVLPSRKAYAILAKTLYNDGSAGLFITHNYKRFGIGRGAWRVLSRYPELRKRIAILNLDEEQFRLLMGIVGIREDDRRLAAQFLFEKTSLDQKIEDLRSGRHFFW